MTELQPARFKRRPFAVDAIQVTAENMQEVANWCDSVIEHTRPNPERGLGETPYVKVPVHGTSHIRQTRAFRNDWVVRADNGSFRVYPKKAFELAFEAMGDKKFISKP